MAAFRGMHVSPAKHSFGKCDRRIDRRTDRHLLSDKVIPIYLTTLLGGGDYNKASYHSQGGGDNKIH